VRPRFSDCYELRMKYVALIIIIFGLMHPIHGVAEELTGVIVRDNQFNVTHELKGEAELKQFEKIWKTKQEVILRARPIWTHKLDINAGDRWLYHTNGFAMVVSKTTTGVFKIDENVMFNKLLNIHNTKLDQTP